MAEVKTIAELELVPSPRVAAETVAWLERYLASAEEVRVDLRITKGMLDQYKAGERSGLGAFVVFEGSGSSKEIRDAWVAERRAAGQATIDVDEAEAEAYHHATEPQTSSGGE